MELEKPRNEETNAETEESAFGKAFDMDDKPIHKYLQDAFSSDSDQSIFQDNSSNIEHWPKSRSRKNGRSRKRSRRSRPKPRPRPRPTPKPTPVPTTTTTITSTSTYTTTTITSTSTYT